MIQKPKKCISVDDARKIETNYIDVVEKAIKKELGKEECRDFWWSIDDIEEYISYVKEKAAEKGYENLGFRFYLGKYGEDKEGKTTMFIAPTKKSIIEKSLTTTDADNENIYDIEPLNDGVNGWPPINY